jgi:hypothetical protein
MILIVLIIAAWAWLAIGVSLALDLSGWKRRYSGFRCIGSGLLLLDSYMIFSLIVHSRNWPVGELEAIDGAGFLVLVPVIALGLRGHRTYAKAQCLNKRRY